MIPNVFIHWIKSPICSCDFDVVIFRQNFMFDICCQVPLHCIQTSDSIINEFANFGYQVGIDVLGVS